MNSPAPNEMSVTGEDLDALWVDQVFACMVCHRPAHGFRSQMTVVADEGLLAGLICPTCVPWPGGRRVALITGRVWITSRGREQWPPVMDLIDRR